jgi:integrase
MQAKLTAALVRRLTETDPPTRDRSYFDTQVPRLVLRVKPSKRAGEQWAALYFARYTAPGDAERRIKVGDPRTMTLAAARAAAKALLAKVDSAGDAPADPAAERTAWTVGEAWAEYEASGEFAKRTPGGRIGDNATARLHVLHRISTVKLADIDVPAVRQLHEAVDGDKRQNARKRRLGGAGAARRAVHVLSSLLTWAVGEGRLDRNPIIGGLRLASGGERTTILDQPEQYARLFETMDRMVAEGRLRAIVRTFVVLLAATGLRRDEARTLRWGDVDLAARRITLRNPDRIRSARRGAATEIVSLPPIAAAVLAAIRPDNADPVNSIFVPAQGKLISVNSDWNRIQNEAELPAGLVMHSLRHSIGAAGIAAGMSIAEIKSMLRHRSITSTQRYVRLAEASRLRLRDRTPG